MYVAHVYWIWSKDYYQVLVLNFFISLFIYVFTFLRVGCRDIHLSEWGSPPPPIQKKTKTFLLKCGRLLVYREHVHTGRQHTRIDYSIFKISNIMSFQWKKIKNLKLEKNQDLNKVKINKHNKDTVTKRCSGKKKKKVFKTDQNPLKITENLQ